MIPTALGESVDFVSRVFAPRIGIFEDPVTSAAHTGLAPFWASKLGKEEN
ncbi:MAG: PhzF family phenazine biosynthesis protein [Granulosicoccus sp.]